MSHVLEITYGDDVLLSAGVSRDNFNAEARHLLAAKLYELGRVSSAQAATLCGMCRTPFLLSLPAIGVSMSNLRPEDAADEVAFAQRDGASASTNGGGGDGEPHGQRA